MKRFYLFSLLLMALVMGMGVKAAAQDMPHIYINPGHGGHDSDDRNVVVPPFASGDTAGFWESNSNLWKGFALQEVLRKKGYTTSISRLANQTSNDLALSTIVALCNQSGADVFYSIHSNATGAGENYRINFPLGLYRGPDNQPIVPESDRLALELVKVLYQNQSTVWTSNYATRGDWSFYPQWNNQGLGVLRGNNAISMLELRLGGGLQLLDRRRQLLRLQRDSAARHHHRQPARRARDAHGNLRHARGRRASAYQRCHGAIA